MANTRDYGKFKKRQGFAQGGAVEGPPPGLSTAGVLDWVDEQKRQMGYVPQPSEDLQMSNSDAADWGAKVKGYKTSDANRFKEVASDAQRRYSSPDEREN